MIHILIEPLAIEWGSSRIAKTRGSLDDLPALDCLLPFALVPRAQTSIESVHHSRSSDVRQKKLRFEWHRERARRRAGKERGGVRAASGISTTSADRTAIISTKRNPRTAARKLPVSRRTMQPLCTGER